MTFNDLEMKKFERPHQGNLSIALFQKSIFDLIAGFWLATAGFNIYGAFDFITFSESL